LNQNRDIKINKTNLQHIYYNRNVSNFTLKLINILIILENKEFLYFQNKKNI